MNVKNYIFPNSFFIKVSGPHAIRYLNARLTNDIAKLEIGRACLAAALTPQGKTEGLFTVIRTASDAALLVCDGGDKEEVISAFRRYIVADRVDVVDESDKWSLCHLYSTKDRFPESSSEFNCKELENNSWIILRKRSNDLGLDYLYPKNSPDLEIFKNTNELDSSQASYLRIIGTVPSFPEEINKERLFLEANLLQAISFTKGCYTGQEVVERISSHGKSPRVLRALKFNAPVAIEDKVSSNGSVVGEVVSIANDENKNFVGFITIKNDETVLSSALLVNGNSASLIE